jgi:hypothetical protein
LREIAVEVGADYCVSCLDRLLKLFPPGKRPRQREVLIEIYRTGKVAEAFQAFKRIYLEIVDQIIDHLKNAEAGVSSR